jgi:tRNA-Thr(GGU) m(6)t(6)A37 methyltransferase TsaA
VIPFLDKQERGLFATRAPKRPNPIGLSLLEIITIDANQIKVRNIDILDGTPLLDIKPYIPQFEPGEDIRIGWLNGKVKNVGSKRSDKRFTE